MADRLRDAGYATALLGKWHLGGTAPFHPQRRGFDEFFGFLHEGHSFVPPPWKGDAPVQPLPPAPAPGPPRFAATAAAVERLNRRVDPRKEAELRRLEGKESGSDDGARSGGGGGGSGLGDKYGGFAARPYDSEDEYYGLRDTPRDHVDPSAFQPSHIFAFEIEPGGHAEFFEEIDADSVRRVVRGDWFVTRCARV